MSCLLMTYTLTFPLLLLSVHSQALVQALEQENTDLFSELIKYVNLTGVQIGKVLNNHETSLGSRVEGQIHRLEQEVASLRWKNEELSRLADMQDHVCFLKVFGVRLLVCCRKWISLKFHRIRFTINAVFFFLCCNSV